MDKPLRLPEPVVETGKTREARSVVALSRVLCGEQSVLVSPPAADQMSWRALTPQAAGRPLVRLPTDRHTATGTCEIGQDRNNISVTRVNTFARANASPAQNNPREP